MNKIQEFLAVKREKTTPFEVVFIEREEFLYTWTGLSFPSQMKWYFI